MKDVWSAFLRGTTVLVLSSLLFSSLSVCRAARLSHMSEGDDGDWQSFSPSLVQSVASRVARSFSTLGDVSAQTTSPVIEDQDEVGFDEDDDVDVSASGSVPTPTGIAYGDLCAGDLPICQLNSVGEQITTLTSFESVAVLRKRSVLFVGDALAFELYVRAVHVLTNGEEKPNPKYAVQRLGSSRIGYQALDVSSGKDLQWYVSQGTLKSDVGINANTGKAKFDAVVFVLTQRGVGMNESTIPEFHTAMREFSRTNVFVLSPFFGLEHDCVDDQVYSRFLTAFARDKVDGLRAIAVGTNEFLAEATTCSFKHTFSAVAVSQLFKTFDAIWPRKKLEGENIAMIVFFAPMIMYTILMESKILSRCVRKRTTPIKLVEDKSSPRELQRLTADEQQVELKVKAKDHEKQSEHEVAGEKLHVNPKDAEFPSVAHYAHDGRMGHLVEWYWSKGGRQIMVSFSIYGVVLALCYLATFNGNVLNLQYGQKTHSLDFYYAWLIVLLLAGVLTLKSQKPEPEGKLAILNRDQTEEWKGFMQVSFVLYHYFHTEETYNLIRVYIACYVWMTGYGNFFFFSNVRDFSFARVMKMVLRMNLFVMFLCFVMSTQYMLYYICCLHTFYFFVVYFAMLPVKLAKKEDTQRVNTIIGASLIGCFIILSVVFENESIFKFLFGAFPIFYLEGSLYEWWFRARLDHYATWFGMCVAFFLPRWSQLQNWIDQDKHAGSRRLKRAGFVSVVLFFALLYINTILFKLDKFSYNAQHPYTSWIPVLLYVLLRNCSPWLRTHNLGIPSWLGKITLETYLLQFHLWLTDDAKTVLVIFEKYPTVNFIFVCAVYILASYATFMATGHIIDFILPSKATNFETLKRSLAFGGVMLGLYLFGLALVVE
eukprot:TRINITY_DN2286_c0_g1_i1.p1 TRINITY_DN2286_c0_g1~~TRINITY_DN2286_c0_g1_i1.p1  ORF type:complete len:915 (-),score=190.45 TRINITY_DN2286_c0_g1_i1:54-2696(-)